MEEMNIITLTGEHYVILAPLEEEEEAYVYKVIGEGATASYEMVEDEAEFDKVVAEYDKIFEEEMRQ